MNFFDICCGGVTIGILMVTLAYVVPYFIRKGWEDGKSK